MQGVETIDGDVQMGNTKGGSTCTTKRGGGKSMASLLDGGRKKPRGTDMSSGTQRRMNLEGGLQSTIRHIRFDLKLTVEPSDSAAVTLLEAISSLLEKIWEVEPGAEILGWAARDGCKPIASLEGLPQKLTLLKKYFKNISPCAKGGFLFSQVHLGINSTTTDFLEEMGWWLEETKSNLWERALQCEDAVCVGWLLYSHDRMDHKLLGKKLGEILEYPVGIKYRVIRLGDYATAEPIGHKTKAAHVEVDVKDSSLARQHLSNCIAPLLIARDTLWN